MTTTGGTLDGSFPDVMAEMDVGHFRHRSMADLMDALGGPKMRAVPHLAIAFESAAIYGRIAGSVGAWDHNEMQRRLGVLDPHWKTRRTLESVYEGGLLKAFRLGQLKLMFPTAGFNCANEAALLEVLTNADLEVPALHGLMMGLSDDVQRIVGNFDLPVEVRLAYLIGDGTVDGFAGVVVWMRLQQLKLDLADDWLFEAAIWRMLPTVVRANTGMFNAQFALVALLDHFLSRAPHFVGRLDRFLARSGLHPRASAMLELIDALAESTAERSAGRPEQVRRYHQAVTAMRQDEVKLFGYPSALSALIPSRWMGPHAK